ncbi:hypothetical protein ACI2UN_25285, partial [Ralstonia nicotianae]
MEEVRLTQPTKRSPVLQPRLADVFQASSKKALGFAHSRVRNRQHGPFSYQSAPGKALYGPYSGAHFFCCRRV